MDHPCDECYGGHNQNRHGDNLSLTSGEGSDTIGEVHAGDKASGAGTNESDVDTSLAEIESDCEGHTDTGTSTTRSVNNWFNPLAREHFRHAPENPHLKQWISRRSRTWTVVYDESIPVGQWGPQTSLGLDVYDILRPCSRFPNHQITDRVISIPLGTLHTRLASVVWNMRRIPQQRSYTTAPQLYRRLIGGLVKR
ncbi:unnamed protein product [Rhizoctonia solani]|uniref:Uncharacterized protein n=1 Tax=Rhizoctonia solani TaxID=456999 RepID=A0A8H2XD04_9AGAM|nr:unnamed protein product [Rhizoctonia solani]